MANHGYVTTRNIIKPEAMTDLLNKLNQERFHGILKIEYFFAARHQNSHHSWEIKCELQVPNCEGATYEERRVCWLNTPHKFEMRHGGGGDFIWWIDCVITNELALVFNGTISDDGGGEKWKGKEGYCPTYRDYVESMWRHNKSPNKNDFINEIINEAPEEFR